MAMQSNLAYDFERFETQRRAPEQKPKLRVVEKKRQARQTRYFVMKAAACITVFFAGILIPGSSDPVCWAGSCYLGFPLSG